MVSKWLEQSKEYNGFISEGFDFTRSKVVL